MLRAPFFTTSRSTARVIVAHREAKVRAYHALTVAIIGLMPIIFSRRVIL
jgi:hypothetical protein